jgi:hypothetical protein
MIGHMDKGHVPHHSQLASARERFLASVLDYAFDDGWRTAQDFLRHFEPATLVRSLAQDDALRTNLLSQTTRVHERLAPRKTVASAAEDLTIALETGLTDAAKVLALIPPDDRVRYLDARKVWAFLTEDEFWKPERRDREGREKLVQRVTFVLESALSERVVRLQDIADGIGFKIIASCLPHAELQRLVEHALSRAREGHRLTEEQLLEAVPLRSLMLHVPLEHTWEQVVVGRVAGPLGLVELDDDDKTEARLQSPDAAALASATASNDRVGRFDPSLLPRTLRDLQRNLHAVANLDDDSDDDVAGDPVTTVAQDPRAASSDVELERVTGALGRLGRLPADHATLTLPILLSIESMYSELSEATDEASRSQIVRDAFPNETHLRTGLVSLIRLLDPARTANDTVLQHSDAGALVSAFLFEEKRLSAGGAPPLFADEPTIALHAAELPDEVTVALPATDLS